MKDLKSLKVGQTCYLVEGDERHKAGNGEYLITKVGKKFFYVNQAGLNEYRERKFEIESWRNSFAREIIQYGSAARLYENEEIYTFDKKWDSFVFNFASKAEKLTKEQKIKIMEILEKN